jgi:hypothetical protein
MWFIFTNKEFLFPFFYKRGRGIFLRESARCKTYEKLIRSVKIKEDLAQSYDININSY